VFGQRDEMRVKWSDLELAFEFASVGQGGENEAYICKRTGKIYWHSESLDDDEELPDDIDDAEKYIPIPDKRELDLGKPLVMDFVSRFLPADFEQVRDIFRRRGAYARFNKLLVQRRALDQWHEYAAKVEEKVLRGWCKAKGIELSE
jgi:hypothetical protein